MMELIDKPTVIAANAGALRVAQRGGGDRVDIYLAGIGMFKQTGDVQKRRLAGARRRHQRHRLARPHRKLGPFENVEPRIALVKLTSDAVQEKKRMFLVIGGWRGCFTDGGFLVHRA